MKQIWLNSEKHVMHSLLTLYFWYRMFQQSACFLGIFLSRVHIHMYVLQALFHMGGIVALLHFCPNFPIASLRLLQICISNRPCPTVIKIFKSLNSVLNSNPYKDSAWIWGQTQNWGWVLIWGKLATAGPDLYP